MALLPEIAGKAWEERDGVIVLTTVDGKGVPNSIYTTCVSKLSEECLIVARILYCYLKLPYL